MDVGYYAPAARTTQKPECSCVLAPKLDWPNHLALFPLGLGGCVPPPGCGYPQKAHDRLVCKLKKYDGNGEYKKLESDSAEQDV